MEKKQPICKTGNINCLNTRRCQCATTQQYVASTSGPKKNKNIDKTKYVNSCARREAGMLELYASRLQQQHQREREVKMYKVIVDGYIRESKEYLPSSVSEKWFGETGILTLPNAGTSMQQHGASSGMVPAQKRSKLTNKAVTSDTKMPQTQQSSSSTSRKTPPRNATNRIAFIGDGSLVDGKIMDVYVAKIICRNCQVEKTMDIASKHILCVACNTE